MMIMIACVCWLLVVMTVSASVALGLNLENCYCPLVADTRKHRNGIQHYAQNLKEACVNTPNQNKIGTKPTLLFDGGISESTRRSNSTPICLKYVVLRKPITTRMTTRNRRGLFGLGFDSRNNDYKVARLSNDGWTKDTPHVEVYSLASRIWRSISVTVPPFCLNDRVKSPSVFLNGALHWLVWRHEGYDEKGLRIWYNFILSFDVIQETFRELTLPQQSNEKAVISRFLPVEGSHSLAVVNHVNTKRRRQRVFCIWVMKDYGITNSWTEIFRLDDKLFGGIFSVLALTSSGKVFLMLHSGGPVVLVDPIKESMEPVGLPEMSEIFVLSFAESLFFLNKEAHVLSF